MLLKLFPFFFFSVTQIIAERLRRLTWRVDWLFRLTAPNKFNFMMENIKIMHEFTHDVIEKRRETLQVSLSKDNNEGN